MGAPWVFPKGLTTGYEHGYHDAFAPEFRWPDVDVDDVQERISCTHGARLTVRTRTGAAIGIVSELVNMHSPLRQRIIAGNIPGDGRRGGFGRLFEGDDPADVGVAPEDGDCGAEKKW